MFCPSCGRTIPEDARFCQFCGADVTVYDTEPDSAQDAVFAAEPQQMKASCSKCGFELEDDAVFCVNCDARLDSASAPEVSATSIVASAPEPPPIPITTSIPAPLSVPADKICPKCGYALEDDAVFCENCGDRIGAAPSPRAAVPPPAAIPVVPPPPLNLRWHTKPPPAKHTAKAIRPSRKKSRGIIIAIPLVIIAGAVAFMFLWNGGEYWDRLSVTLGIARTGEPGFVTAGELDEASSEPSALPSGTTNTYTADDDRVSFGGHQYKRFDESMSWSAAKAYAESLGGYLTTVTTQAEQDFIVSLITDSPQNYYWLGGINNGGWQWVTGETWNYTEWEDWEPDGVSGVSGAAQNSLSINTDTAISSDGNVQGTYKWGDTQDDGDPGTAWAVEYSGFIVEWDGANTPLQQDGSFESQLRMLTAMLLSGGEPSQEAWQGMSIHITYKQGTDCYFAATMEQDGQRRLLGQFIAELNESGFPNQVLTTTETILLISGNGLIYNGTQDVTDGDPSAISLIPNAQKRDYNMDFMMGESLPFTMNGIMVTAGVHDTRGNFDAYAHPTLLECTVDFADGNLERFEIPLAVCEFQGYPAAYLLPKPIENARVISLSVTQSSGQQEYIAIGEISIF